MKNLTLYERASLFSQAFPHLAPLQYHEEKLYGFWFLGGARTSTYDGSYHTNYIERVQSLFPDAKQIVHLFAGSIPPGPYTRIGYDNTEHQYKPDIIGNAEHLSSFLTFHPDLIYADPPYSQEDAEHFYNTNLVNRPKVVSECALVLQRGGYLVWLDQVLPVFRNEELRLVGMIGYIRSTGNRFRCVSIFRKP